MKQKGTIKQRSIVKVAGFEAIALVIPLLTFLFAPSSTAQNIDTVDAKANQIDLTIIPNSLTIAGTRNTFKTRNLVLKAASEVKNLKIMPLDLNRVDGLEVVQASKISINEAENTENKSQNIEITANNPISVPINVNLDGINASGEYSGVLLVRYDDGEATIPITLKIRDPLWWAIIPLVIGVVLGYFLSQYQAEGFERDEVLVQVGKLRRGIEADREFEKAFSSQVNPFLTKINALMVDVDTALENKNWKDAKKAADDARQVWNKWLKHKPNWLQLLAFKREELENHLNDRDLSVDLPYGKAVKRNLENAESRMADFENPQDFKQELEKIKQQIDNYHEGKKLLNQLNANISEAPENRKQNWRTIQAALQNNLDYLLPTEEKYQEWEKEVKQEIKELRKEIDAAKAPETKSTEAALIARNVQTTDNLIPPVQNLPILTSSLGSQTSEQAAQRLYWTRQVGHAIAIIFLSLLGFNQLYWSNLTFGANPVSDYFSLLAWGFGAEVTRESVTKVLQGLRIPSVK